MSSPDIVYAIHDFNAENEDEITFQSGEPLIILQKDEQYMDGWWQGQNVKGEIGLFPINYTTSEKPATTTTNTKSSASIASSTSSNPLLELQPTESRQLNLERSSSYSKDEEKSTIGFRPTRVSSGASSSASSSTNLSTPVDQVQDIYQHPAVTAPSVTPSLTDKRPSCSFDRNDDSSTSTQHTCNSSPDNWSMEDVVKWLKSVGLESVVDNFIDQEITGDILLSLDHEALKELGITAYGRRYKVINAIKHLKASTEETNLSQTDNGQSYHTSTIPNINTQNSSKRITQNYFQGLQLQQSANAHGFRYGSVTEPSNFRSSNAISSLNQSVVSPTVTPSTSTTTTYYNRNSTTPSGPLQLRINDPRYTYTSTQAPSSPIRASMLHTSTPSTSSSTMNTMNTPTTPKRSTFQEALKTTSISQQQQQQQQQRNTMLMFANNTTSLSSASTATLSSISSSITPAITNNNTTLDTHHFHGSSQPPSPQLPLPLVPPPQQPLPQQRSSTTAQQQDHHLEHDLALYHTVSKSTDHFPEFEGWLYKQSDRYKTWNKRWFVLYGTNLFYFKNPKDMRMKGIIHLRGYRVIVEQKKAFASHAGNNSSNHTGYSNNSKKNYFKLHHDHERTFYFYTSDAMEMRKWVQVLMKATIKRDLCVPVVSSNNIETVPLDIAQKMKPRPPSTLMYNVTSNTLQQQPQHGVPISPPSTTAMNDIRHTLVINTQAENNDKATMDDDLLDETLLWMEHPNGNHLEEPLQKLIIRSYPSLVVEEEEEEDDADKLAEQQHLPSFDFGSNSSFIDHASSTSSTTSSCRHASSITSTQR